MIVEGADDRHSVVGLLKAHVDWPKPEHAWPVHIHMGNGAEEILSDGVLLTYLKGSTVKNFGIMLDADTKPRGRYAAVRKICLELFPNLPADLPAEGVVVANVDGQRLGVWIMPDNAADGSLETFLKYLVPADGKKLWEHAEKSVGDATTLGASFTPAHREKAVLYTWLAWQEPPGQAPGICLTKKILDPHSATAASFVAWFINLYELPPMATLFPMPPHPSPATS